MTSRVKSRTVTILVTLLTLNFGGCGEIIAITGIVFNRLSNNSSVTTEILVNVINSDKKLVRNFNISVKENFSNKCLFSPKFSNSNFPVSFSLPDEQINPLPPETSKVIISAEYPGYPIFEQQIDASLLKSSKITSIEIIVGSISDSLVKGPLMRYIQCK